MNQFKNRKTDAPVSILEEAFYNTYEKYNNGDLMIFLEKVFTEFYNKHARYLSRENLKSLLEPIETQFESIRAKYAENESMRLKEIRKLIPDILLTIVERYKFGNHYVKASDGFSDSARWAGHLSMYVFMMIAERAFDLKFYQQNFNGNKMEELLKKAIDEAASVMQGMKSVILIDKIVNPVVMKMFEYYRIKKLQSL